MMNRLGAVSVRGMDGSWLGVKPDEFEWVFPSNNSDCMTDEDKLIAAGDSRAFDLEETYYD